MSQKLLEIVNIDRYDGDAVVIDFSDGTSSTFTVEELAALRPDRIQPSEDQEPADPRS